ncbi:hypothetical protein JXC34_00640, partial [Candidatus Woesearchaeota archaeon]|nr:hypothetical protein [Candidatus Woesearchaeota archaeon]
MTSDNDNFIIDVGKIDPKKEKSDEHDFIVSTMDMAKERSKDKKISKKRKKPAKKKAKKTEEDKGPFKHIDQVEEDIKKQIEFRELVKHDFPILNLKKTSQIFSDGWNYFLDIEEFITKDFFFGWLPKKIRKYIKLIIPLAAMVIILSLDLNIS